MFSYPHIFQSDNGREFAKQSCKGSDKVVARIHGKPRHSQSQGSVERANQDVENILACWKKDNNTTSWSDGLRFVQ